MSKQGVFSITKGYHFTFEDEGSKIKAWFSSLSGLEKIYVNGELISSQRNLSKNSFNTFKIGENEYSTNMQAISLIKGPYVCTLSKNGQVYKRQKLLFKYRRHTKNAYLLLFFIFAALFVGPEMAESYWKFPKEYVSILIGILYLVVLVKIIRHNKKTTNSGLGIEILIEEESVD